jgi:hypothetical protein
MNSHRFDGCSNRRGWLPRTLASPAERFRFAPLSPTTTFDPQERAPIESREGHPKFFDERHVAVQLGGPFCTCHRTPASLLNVAAGMGMLTGHISAMMVPCLAAGWAGWSGGD